MNAQADLNLCWVDMSKGTFLMLQLICFHEEIIKKIIPELLQNTPSYIGLDKNGYQVYNFFLFLHEKHMLWILIRSVSPRHF